MKQTFNAKGQQTYASRQESLEAHARQIDDFLRTPSKPGVHFTPQGTMRRNGTQAAHQALTQKRVDITQELDRIKREMAKRQDNQQTKTVAKGL
ncbi:MAG: hypothetical protein GC152_08680 [Alphaproteobacteria bacterium]|nr:hypothetical protein [Alphaproteobacteria bacterium]